MRKHATKTKESLPDRKSSIIHVVAADQTSGRAILSWEGDSLEVVRGWPKQIRQDFGVALGEMQEGRAAALRVRPMPSIAPGVFELKDDDERKWYRMIYLARVRGTIYILHCFEKDTGKTEKKDLSTAAQRWKLVQQRLREERQHDKREQQDKGTSRNPGTRAG